MEAKDLGKLLRVLRRNGVTRYQDGEIKILLGGPVPVRVNKAQQLELAIPARPALPCQYCNGTGKLKVDEQTMINCGFCSGTGSHKQVAEEKVLFASAN